jgi:RHS repeat-associated protein
MQLPYGKQLAATGTIVNPWRYASGYYDTATGLTKFGARYYNPDLGRFTQRDPSGKDLPYTYASCNPVNNTDLTGQSGCSESLTGYSITGGLLVSTAESAEIAGAVVEGAVVAAAGPAVLILGTVFAVGLAAIAIAKCT